MKVAYQDEKGALAFCKNILGPIEGEIGVITRP